MAYIHWLCRITGHDWDTWRPVGHVPRKEWRPCKRGCTIGEMRVQRAA
jgi:hypothetical protein